VESHHAFASAISPDITLLSDPDASVVKSYDVFLGLGSKGVTKRAYLLLDKNRTILYKHLDGVTVLDNQSDTLIKSIDGLITP
jgi:peroxiredoxin